MDILQTIANSRFDKEPSQISLFDCMKYILGGEAIFTVFPIKQDKHYVYQCEQVVSYAKEDVCKEFPIKENRWWLRLLTAPNNMKDYTYVGTIDNVETRSNILTLRITPKSAMTAEAPAFKVFQQLLYILQCRPEDIVPFMNRIKVYHDGHCSICGRKLTSIVSTSVGMGPVCAPEIHTDYKLECKKRGIILPKNNKDDKEQLVKVVKKRLIC